MIIDELANLDFYAARDPRLAVVARFLKEHPADALADGRYELEGGAFGTLASHDTREDGPFEAHRRYADLHLVVRGSEAIEYAPIDAVAGGGDYDAQNDCILYEGAPVDSVRVPLPAGRFLVAWPQDAHKPLLRLRDDVSRKWIFKLPVD